MYTMALGTFCLWGFFFFTIGGLFATLLLSLCRVAQETDERMGIE